MILKASEARSITDSVENKDPLDDIFSRIGLAAKSGLDQIMLRISDKHIFQVSGTLKELGYTVSPLGTQIYTIDW